MYKEITFSFKIILQAILKAEGPLKFLLDNIRPVSIQHVNFDCLFKRLDNAQDSWSLVQDVITL